MSTHSINVDGLVALDVHVHLEHTGEETEADKKAAAYFKGGGARDAASLAEYYRSRKMACVIFTVDETLSGVPRLSNDAVLEFAISEDELFTRLKGRGRADDTEDVIHNRMQVYRDETEPLLEYYSHNNLKSVDAIGALDEVFARALRALGR